MLADGTDQFGALAHGWTYSAHPVSCAAGVATLGLVDSIGLVDNAAAIGPKLLAALRDAAGDHPNVGEIRGEGLMAAVEFMENPAQRQFYDKPMAVSSAISAAMLRHGVIARPMREGNIIGFAPPLCITEDEVNQLARALRRAIQEVLPR